MGKFENNGFRTKRLLNYATDLTQMAMEGKLDPVIGRSKEIERVQQILCQRRKNNPCLLGNPGVGKTAIVEGLAQEIVNETVPLNLQGIKVFALETGRLVARTRYRGEIEERLVEVIEEVKESDGEIILFIDDLHTLIGDCHFPRSFDVASILKSALSRGDIKCIAATTVKEYQGCIAHDQALQRRFQQVDVPEPTVHETIEILEGLRKKYEDFHRITYEDDALVAAASLSKKFISCGVLPDMAIDLIDEAGAKAQLRRNSVNRNSSDKGIVSKNVINFKRSLVRERDIHLIISTRTGISIHEVSGD